MEHKAIHAALASPREICSLAVTTSGKCSASRRKSAKMWKVWDDSARAVAMSSSRRDRASATVLVLPGLYSTLKSYPKSLLTQVCCGIVERRWSNKYLRE